MRRGKEERRGMGGRRNEGNGEYGCSFSFVAVGSI